MGKNDQLAQKLLTRDVSSEDVSEETSISPSINPDPFNETSHEEVAEEYFMAAQLISLRAGSRSSQTTHRIIQSLRMSGLGKYLNECSDQDMVGLSHSCTLERLSVNCVKDRKDDTIADIYIVLSGVVGTSANDGAKAIGVRYASGALVGECVFQRSLKWEHDVIALSDVSLCCISVTAVLRHIGVHVDCVEEFMRCFWKKSMTWLYFKNNPQPVFFDAPLLFASHIYEDIPILSFGKLKTFYPGETIFCIENEHFAMYLIYKGECSMSRRMENLEINLNELYGISFLPGDFVLLENIPIQSLNELIKKSIDDDHREEVKRSLFGYHGFQLRALTFVQVITIPLDPILRSRAALMKILSIMHRKYPQLLLSDTDILLDHREKSSWRSERQQLQIRKARVTRLQRTLNENFFVSHMSNYSYSKYNAFKGGVKRISRFIRASDENKDACVDFNPQRPTKEKSSRVNASRVNASNGVIMITS